MATFNQVFYQAPGKLIQVNDTTNEFIVSGYRLIVDKDLNRDLLIVQTPSSTGDFGERGNISFDEHHIYYCKAKNTWLRGKLASWEDNEPDQLIGNIPNLNITNPTNWWKFTLMGSQPITNLGNYQFGGYQISQNYFVSMYMPSPGEENTDLSGFRNSNTNRYYLNSSTNLVDLAGLNQDFSISFETSRRPNASNQSNFILGNLFGGVGFHFRFASKVTLNSGNYLSGDNIVFGLNAHVSGLKGGDPFYGAFNNLEEIYWDNPGYGNGSGIPGKGNGNRWINVVSTGSFPVDGPLQQIVATNNASSKEIKLYVNGELQATKSYANTPITNVRVIYPNSQCVGWGIGATPLGGARGPVNIAGLRSLVNVKNLGFWKNTVLDQAQITLLYNGGNFKTYPFI